MRGTSNMNSKKLSTNKEGNTFQVWMSYHELCNFMCKITVSSSVYKLTQMIASCETGLTLLTFSAFNPRIALRVAG